MSRACIVRTSFTYTQHTEPHCVHVHAYIYKFSYWFSLFLQSTSTQHNVAGVRISLFSRIWKCKKIKKWEKNGNRRKKGTKNLGEKKIMGTAIRSRSCASTMCTNLFIFISFFCVCIFFIQSASLSSFDGAPVQVYTVQYTHVALASPLRHFRTVI